MSPLTLLAPSLILVSMLLIFVPAHAQVSGGAIQGGNDKSFSMSPQGKEVTGTYSNINFGLEFVIPQGYVGQEMSFDKNMLTIAITSKTTSNSEIPSNMVIQVKLGDQTTDMKVGGMKVGGGESQCKDSKLPDTSIDGKKFTVISTECTFGEQKIQTKNFSADLNGLHYTLSLDNSFAKFDEIVKTIKISEPQTSTTDITDNREIPEWVKTVFQYWIDGEISEDEVKEAIRFLVNSKIIVL